MLNWIRYGWPRKYIIWVACRIWPQYGSKPDWLLNFLYPPDAFINFK